ncbi:MAG: type II toxin-antitoxin system RelE/ParE family toxin [Deltaproteobacteria bacterium]|nr:type II toxin-antitoxin system RelE/ParE family toxin [Deltaproteobacteria bacterium]
MGHKELKNIVWIGSSREELKKFPEPIKDEIGYAIYRAQEGKKHHKAKPLKGFSGVLEITSSYKTDTYRAVYAIKLGDCIYVFHTFKKKSHKGIKTPKPDMEIIRKRLKEAHILAKEVK